MPKEQVKKCLLVVLDKNEPFSLDRENAKSKIILTITGIICVCRISNILKANENHNERFNYIVRCMQVS